ncbi:uncharacterized protein KRP23_4238 [Phytophthora ramorum]|uniref:uncharacterized protein n=1 Tax=Phytophthora ramorum TaxID=164328 RepID=UPI0030B2EF31|nr:hypothetical protein KRP23_4238 [Phytophthora ramorum]
MKYRLPKDAFRAAWLPQEHQDALVQEAETVVRETIEANEAFLDSESTFQNPSWRLVREKEGLRVYCQRRKSRRGSRTHGDQWRQESLLPASQSSSWANPRYRGGGESVKGCEIGTERETALSSKSAFAENTIMERMKPSGVHLMALHGTMDGTLDDCMFGCFAPTDEAWKLRSLHINDRLDDSRIISTIHGPTQEDPFRFLGIKWFTKENSAVLSSIVQQRDFLIVESSGLTRDSKGERVGYFLMHSVTVLDVPELSGMGIVRGKMSFCSIFRQSRPGQLTVHSLGFFDTCGGIPSRVSVALAAEGAISFVNVVDYAYIKKLAWLMRSKGEQSGKNSTLASCCAACDKSFRKFSLSASRSGGACRICRQVFCAKCSVVKKMTVHVSDTSTAKQCSFRFCLGCLLTAKKQSVWDMTSSANMNRPCSYRYHSDLPVPLATVERASSSLLLLSCPTLELDCVDVFCRMAAEDQAARGSS